MSGEVFATVADLEARWREMDRGTNEAARAEKLLADASALIRELVPTWSKAEPATLEAVTCAVVIRAMSSNTVPTTMGGAAVPFGVKSVQAGAGPYQETYSYANPTGDLYLTRGERERLGGVGRARAGNVNLLDDPEAGQFYAGLGIGGW